MTWQQLADYIAKMSPDNAVKPALVNMDPGRGQPFLNSCRVSEIVPVHPEETYGQSTILIYEPGA